MFSGLISALGVVERAEESLFAVRCPRGFLQGAAVGGSIAVDGACLTVTGLQGEVFAADLSAETRLRCAPWKCGQKVNLEKPLRVGDELGGHFVTGHIDGVATVSEIKKENNGGATLTITPPAHLSKLIAEKGSVALSGISLTVGEVNDGDNGDNENENNVTFKVHIIPHTIKATTIGEWKPGAQTNIEADPLARYAARILA